MKVLSSVEAATYNAGFFSASQVNPEVWARNRCVSNPLRPAPEESMPGRLPPPSERHPRLVEITAPY